MYYCNTSHCPTCICRAVADKLEIVEVVSNPQNHAMEKRELQELIQKRRLAKEEQEIHGVPV